VAQVAKKTIEEQQADLKKAVYKDLKKDGEKKCQK